MPGNVAACSEFDQAFDEAWKGLVSSVTNPPNVGYLQTLIQVLDALLDTHKISKQPKTIPLKALNQLKSAQTKYLPSVCRIAGLLGLFEDLPFSDVEAFHRRMIGFAEANSLFDITANVELSQHVLPSLVTLLIFASDPVEGDYAMFGEALFGGRTPIATTAAKFPKQTAVLLQCWLMTLILTSDEHADKYIADFFPSLLSLLADRSEFKDIHPIAINALCCISEMKMRFTNELVPSKAIPTYIQQLRAALSELEPAAKKRPKATRAALKAARAFIYNETLPEAEFTILEPARLTKNQKLGQTITGFHFVTLFRFLQMSLGAEYFYEMASTPKIFELFGFVKEDHYFAFGKSYYELKQAPKRKDKARFQDRKSERLDKELRVGKWD